MEKHGNDVDTDGARYAWSTTTHNPAPYSLKYLGIALGITTTTTLLLIITLITLYVNHMPTAQPTSRLGPGCGNTTENAHSLHCNLEGMFYGWTPAECYFPDLSKQYDVFNDRNWFSDWEMDIRLTPTELEYGIIRHIYVPYYHDDHCVFMWKKLLYGLAWKRMVDSKTLRWEHTAHCAQKLLFEPQDGEVQEIVLGFYHCQHINNDVVR